MAVVEVLPVLGRGDVADSEVPVVFVAVFPAGLAEVVAEHDVEGEVPAVVADRRAGPSQLEIHIPADIAIRGQSPDDRIRAPGAVGPDNGGAGEGARLVGAVPSAGLKATAAGAAASAASAEYGGAGGLVDGDHGLGVSNHGGSEHVSDVVILDRAPDNISPGLEPLGSDVHAHRRITAAMSRI